MCTENWCSLLLSLVNQRWSDAANAKKERKTIDLLQMWDSGISAASLQQHQGSQTGGEKRPNTAWWLQARKKTLLTNALITLSSQFPINLTCHLPGKPAGGGWAVQGSGASDSSSTREKLWGEQRWRNQETMVLPASHKSKAKTKMTR